VDLLRPVEVPEGDVARPGRQNLRRGGPVLSDMDAALGFAEKGPLEVRMRHENVDGVPPEAAAEVLDGALEHPGVLAPGSRLLADEVERGDPGAGGGERQRRDDRQLSAPGADHPDASLGGGARAAE